MNPRAAGILAGVGIIVELLGLAQHGDFIFAVIGVGLLLVGTYYISKECLNDKRFFNFLLASRILSLIIMIVIPIVMTVAFSSSAEKVTNKETTWFMEKEEGPWFIEPRASNRNENILEKLRPLIPEPIGYLLLIFLVISRIIWGIFNLKAFRIAATHLKMDLFQKAATFYKWGAILSVVLVGFVLLLIADIIAMEGFFTIPDESKAAPAQ